MKTFQLPANSNYGDRPIPVTFPDNWDVSTRSPGIPRGPTDTPGR